MTSIRTKIASVILTLVTAVVCCMLCVACNDGNNGGDNFKHYVTVSGVVRTASYVPLQEQIYYDGEVVGTSDAQGMFEISIPIGSDEDNTAKLGLASDSFRYVKYDGQMRVVIIKLDDGMQISDFYFLSGKVVLQSDGETVATGAELRIDGNTVWPFDTNGNFDLEPVHKDSIVSAYKEGYEFVTATMKPYNDICFADALETTTETRTLTVNGKSETLKCITGVTFRLNDIE